MIAETASGISSRLPLHPTTIVQSRPRVYPPNGGPKNGPKWDTFGRIQPSWAGLAAASLRAYTSFGTRELSIIDCDGPDHGDISDEGILAGTNRHTVDVNCARGSHDPVITSPALSALDHRRHIAECLQLWAHLRIGNRNVQNASLLNLAHG
jgi:hypothetical protein